MKDIPHHIKKLTRKVIRSMRRETQLEETLPDLPVWPDSEREKRKKTKRQMKAERKAYVPQIKTEEERNREMKKGRVPVFDRQNAKPKHAKASQKKTPRI